MGGQNGAFATEANEADEAGEERWMDGEKQELGLKLHLRTRG